MTPTGVRRTLAAGALLTLGLGAGLGASGCAAAPGESPPTGVDELTIPTPSPDPDDFVAEVDNRWLPLDPGAERAVLVAGASITVTVAAETVEVAGVATTPVTTALPAGAVTDYYAQDADGNVWWFGREGEWRAGESGAEAGLAMPAEPRVGDGFRRGTWVDGDERATVVLVEDDTVELEVTDAAGSIREETYAAGEGLVSVS